MKKVEGHVQDDIYFRSHQSNPYLNNSFRALDMSTHHPSYYTKHYSSFIKNHLWPEKINITDDTLKLPPTDNEIHTIYLQGHNVISKNDYKNTFYPIQNGGQPVSDKQVTIKMTKTDHEPSHDLYLNDVLTGSRNVSHGQSYVLRKQNHLNFDHNPNNNFVKADKSLYLNKVYKNFDASAEQNGEATPFIRNEKTTERILKENSEIIVNIKNVSLEMKQLEKLKQQKNNKTIEEFHKKIDEALYAQKDWFHKKDQTADDADIDNDTISLWQPWAHTVKDHAKINAFIQRILVRNMNLFHTVGDKTKDKKWKNIIREIAEAYEERFKKFAKDTKKHKVKSRMGSERAILNCIEVSNRIIKRLLNYVLDEMDKKGHLKNTHALNIIAKELKVKTKSELKRTCLKLGICRSRNGFTDFLIDFLTTVISQEDKIFQTAYNALTAAVRSTDLSKTLGVNSDETLKALIRKLSKENMMFKRTATTIIKNIILKRNTPLIVYGDNEIGKVNRTIALLEIVNILDKYVPENDENFKTWMDLKGKLDNFVIGRDNNVQETMLAFVQHIKKVIEAMNSKSFVQILHDSQIVLS